MQLTLQQQATLDGRDGPTRQKAMRLLTDLGAVAGAKCLIPITTAHLAGVSPLTGGHGLRRMLADLSDDPKGVVQVSSTLNSAGCDAHRFTEMGITVENFLEHHFEIVAAYKKMGVEATLSCTPYDRDIVLPDGAAAWSESNAICYANSFTKQWTNRESGLSALASALTGFTPKYGFHLKENRMPNIKVKIECDITDVVDYSIIGDWIGKNLRPEWKLPLGSIPYIQGLPKDMGLDEKKALSAAAANYGSALLYVKGVSEPKQMPKNWVGELTFTKEALSERYDELKPQEKVDLVVIGCPQASFDEISRTAKMVEGRKIPESRLWLFTSHQNWVKARDAGLVKMLEEAGVLVLKDTCPEVVPYDRNKVKHILTNSLKAEHYLMSGLNSLPTSVARLNDCIDIAQNPALLTRDISHDNKSHKTIPSAKTPKFGGLQLVGEGLNSQTEWTIEGRALVTDVPITYLGFVNRDTGVIQEAGHPLDGEAIENTVLVYPKGSGSTVAPYVLMGLLYTNRGPLAIINRDICSLTLPAASLLGLPYAHSFNADPCLELNNGDEVEMTLVDGEAVLKVLKRSN